MLEDSSWTPLTDIDPVNVHTVGAFRACLHGATLAYEAVLESSGPRAVDIIVDMLTSVAGLTVEPGPTSYYAQLDVLDARGEWLGDTFFVPSEEAFEYVRRTLALRTTLNDCILGCK